VISDVPLEFSEFAFFGLSVDKEVRTMQLQIALNAKELQ
jgi:hypothetical protein